MALKRKSVSDEKAIICGGSEHGANPEEKLKNPIPVKHLAVSNYTSVR